MIAFLVLLLFGPLILELTYVFIILVIIYLSLLITNSSVTIALLLHQTYIHFSDSNNMDFLTNLALGFLPIFILLGIPICFHSSVYLCAGKLINTI